MASNQPKILKMSSLSRGSLEERHKVADTLLRIKEIIRKACIDDGYKGGGIFSSRDRHRVPEEDLHTLIMSSRVTLDGVKVLQDVRTRIDYLRRYLDQVSTQMDVDEDTCWIGMLE